MTLFARSTGLLPPLLLGLAIDAVLLGTRRYELPLVPATWVPETAAGQVWFTAGVLVAAALASAVASWLQGYGWNHFAQNIQHALRVDAYEVLQRQDRAFFDDRGPANCCRC
nr:ABC transporter transmembrane domain-containing protein [Halogeometricum sp. CBA1124]